jgi:hypothetical protein
LGFLALAGLSAPVTAVKLSAAQLAGGAASKPSPKATLANVDDKCRVVMAVSLSFVVLFIIGKTGTSASADSSAVPTLCNRRLARCASAITMVA